MIGYNLQLFAKRGNGNGTYSSSSEYNRDSFDKEAERQGIDITSDDIDDYVTASYGGYMLGNKISQFIDNAPENMKVGNATVYRGLGFENAREFEAFLRNGTIETRRDGLSWTTDREVADEFSVNAYDYSVTLVNTDSKKNAISIRGISDTPSSSSEVLYSSSTDFRVTGIRRNGNTATVFVTEQPGLRKKYR